MALWTKNGLFSVLRNIMVINELIVVHTTDQALIYAVQLSVPALSEAL